MRGNRSKLAGLTPIDIAGVAVAAALLALFVFGVLGPLAARSRLAAARVQEIARQKQRTSGTVAAVRNLAEDIARMRSRMAASPLHIRSQSALNEQLAALVGLSSECGLTLNDIKPGAAVRGVRFAAVPIVVTGHGSYRASADFLHRLHDRFPDVGVRGFQLTGSPEQSAADGHYVLDLQWLALPQDQPAAVATAAAQ